MKPKIRKLNGLRTWVCQHRDLPVMGFGITPALAYHDWHFKARTW